MEMALNYLDRPQEIETIKRLFNTNPQTGTTHEGMIAGLTALDLPFERSVSIPEPFKWLDENLKKGHLFLMRTRTFGYLHWILCYGKLKDKYLICDPAQGYIRLTQEEVQERWEPRDWDGFAIKIPVVGEVIIRPIETMADMMEAFIATYQGFEEFPLYMSLKGFAGTVLGGIRDNPQDSWVATHRGEAVGGYFLGHRQITDSFSTYKEVKPYIGKVGIEGVALGVLPTYRGFGVGKALREIPKHMDVDYIWGQHFDCLNNLANWVKFGRKHMFSYGGTTGGRASAHVTLMDLR